MRRWSQHPPNGEARRHAMSASFPKADVARHIVMSAECRSGSAAVTWCQGQARHFGVPGPMGNMSQEKPVLGFRLLSTG
jgi:hypothetical protein